MNILKSGKRLQEEWERGVERAVEETPRTLEADPKRLDTTVGLTVKAQIRSGKVTVPGCGGYSIPV